jgi:pilus assembly protein CpaB
MDGFDMNKVNKKVLILSFLLTIFFVVVLNLYLKKKMVEPVFLRTQESMETRSVLVAASYIPKSKKIVDSDIKEVSMDVSLVNVEGILKKEDILGKYAKQNIYPHEQWMKEKLSETFEETVLLEIPKGKRAVTIPVNALTAVAYHPDIGNLVDVVVVFEKETVGALPEFQRSAQIAIQNAKVLSYGIITPDQPSPRKDSTQMATLLVKAQDAEKLIYASKYAEIRLILKGQGDEETVETTGAVRADFKP